MRLLLIAFLSFIFFAQHSHAQLRAKDPIHVNSEEEAKWVMKVLKIELGLDDMQQVRVQKIFDNYLRRIEKAKVDYATDSVQLNTRLKLLVDNRDATLKKTFGEEGTAMYEALLPQMRLKIAELKKRAAK